MNVVAVLPVSRRYQITKLDKLQLIHQAKKTALWSTFKSSNLVSEQISKYLLNISENTMREQERQDKPQIEALMQSHCKLKRVIVHSLGSSSRRCCSRL